MAGYWTDQNIKTAYDALLPVIGHYGACGLVGRWSHVESTAKGPNDVNPSSGAVGIAQWLGERKAKLNALAFQSGLENQIKFVILELNTTEANAADRLKTATNLTDAATGACMYERAEEYNPVTGRDKWWPQTFSGAQAVETIVGAAPSPTPVPQPMPAPAASPAYVPTRLESFLALLAAAVAKGIMDSVIEHPGAAPGFQDLANQIVTAIKELESK